MTIRPPPTPRRRTRGQQLQLLLVFLIAYSALLFVVRPARSRAQAAIRGGTIAVAVVGLVVLRWRGR